MEKKTAFVLRTVFADCLITWLESRSRYGGDRLNLSGRYFFTMHNELNDFSVHILTRHCAGEAVLYASCRYVLSFYIFAIYFEVHSPVWQLPVNVKPSVGPDVCAFWIKCCNRTRTGATDSTPKCIPPNTSISIAVSFECQKPICYVHRSNAPKSIIIFAPSFHHPPFLGLRAT